MNRCTCEIERDATTDCPRHGCTCGDGPFERDWACPQHGDEAAYWSRGDVECDRKRGT